jgi:hypothetical protein
MLAWNQRKVRQLTPAEIWLFIAGRVFASLGVGILLVSYVPSTAVAGWPALGLGAVLLFLASKGFARRGDAVEQPR